MLLILEREGRLTVAIGVQACRVVHCPSGQGVARRARKTRRRILLARPFLSRRRHRGRRPARQVARRLAAANRTRSGCSESPREKNVTHDFCSQAHFCHGGDTANDAVRLGKSHTAARRPIFVITATMRTASGSANRTRPSPAGCGEYRKPAAAANRGRRLAAGNITRGRLGRIAHDGARAALVAGFAVAGR